MKIKMVYLLIEGIVIPKNHLIITMIIIHLIKNNTKIKNLFQAKNQNKKDQNQQYVLQIESHITIDLITCLIE